MYSIGFIINDSELIQKFKELEYFTGFEVRSSLKDFENNINVLIISDRLVKANELVQDITIKDSNFKNIFYMISNENYSNNVKNIMKAKNITTIPPKLTNSQIMEFVLEKVFNGVKAEKNIVTFFGADSKVGTTMIAQSVAEEISKHISKYNKKTLLCCMSGKHDNEYINNPSKKGLDYLKTKLINGILSIDEFIDACIKKDELYILEGANYVPELRYYHPTHIESLFELISNEFSLIIIDAGSNIELGTTIGALNLNKFRFLVTTQQESAFNKYSNTKEQILDKLEINDFMLILNKYVDDEMLLSSLDTANRYNSTLSTVVPYLKWGWQAEKDKKTLLNYGEKEYNDKINEISLIILNHFGFKTKKKEEIKLSWYKKLFSKTSK